MLENGYIKDHRTLLSWGWFKDPFTAHLWEYLRLAANWDERIFKGHTIGRGQLVTSYPSMADATGMSVQNVRTAVKHLKQTGEISMKSYRDFSIITITNYEKYQSDQQSVNSPVNSPANSQLTGCQQSTNSQLTTNEESKKARKQESKKSIGGAGAPADLAALETRFGDRALAEAVSDWIAYKQERRDAYKPVGLKSLLTQIENQAKAHGAKPVADVIRLSMSNGWKGIIWERMQAVETAEKTSNPFWEMLWEEEKREAQRYDADYGDY